MTAKIPFNFIIFIAFVTTCLYLKTAQYGLVWDDSINMEAVSSKKASGTLGFIHFWKKPVLFLYIPVTYTTWWFLAKFEKKVVMMHAANLFLHTLNAILVLFILNSLFEIPLQALMGALFFAVHPLQVESVAWVTGLKDLLGGFFSLLSILGFIYYLKKKSTFGLVWAFFAFVLGMLSKPSTVSVLFVAPIMMMFFDLKNVKKIPLLLPHFAIAAGLTFFTYRLQNTTPLVFDVPFFQRPILMAHGILFYLFKTLFPYPLYIDYGKPPAVVMQNGVLFLILFGLLTIGIFFIRKRSNFKSVILSLLVFIGGLLPNLGIFTFAFQGISTVADRFTYIAMLGPSIFLASIFHSRIVPKAIYLFILGVFSLVQIGVWLGPDTLYLHSVKFNPKSHISHTGIGGYYSGKGDHAMALKHHLLALQTHPNDKGYEEYFDRIYYSIAVCHRHLGNQSEAKRYLKYALKANPNHVSSLAMLSMILIKEENISAGLIHLKKMSALLPKRANILFQIGNLSMAIGDFKSAAEYFKRVTEIEPENIKALIELGNSYIKLKDFSLATVIYESLISKYPESRDVQSAYQGFISESMETKNKG